jgi:ribosome-binding protein aMBF1 (putative translation factor)
MALIKRPLSAWSKKVKKALIDKNMTINELAETIGYNSTYTRNIVNGKIVSATVAEKKINDVLGIR